VQHRPREPEAARIVRLHDEREGVDVTELRAAMTKVDDLRKDGPKL